MAANGNRLGIPDTAGATQERPLPPGFEIEPLIEPPPLRLMEKVAALVEAGRQLAALRWRSRALFRPVPKPGHLRGIDFYGRLELLLVAGRVFGKFRKRHGAFPNIVRPTTFSEKVVWMKFFSHLPVPLAGNKCLTQAFVPPDLAGVAAVPIVYRSTSPVLPPNDALAPGSYFLKANHGSDMNRPVRYPLSVEERCELEAECARWLTQDYGRPDGEWWYATFAREIILEQSLSDQGPAPSWCFLVLEGVVSYIMVARKVDGSTQVVRLDNDFGLLRIQAPEYTTDLRFDDYGMRDRLMEVARAIARPFPMVRVDLYVTADHRIYLGEMTFAPGNGLIVYPDDMDARFGRALSAIG